MFESNESFSNAVSISINLNVDFQMDFQMGRFVLIIKFENTNPIDDENI